MFMLEIMQKTMRTSMEAVVKKLGIRKGEDSRGLCSYEHGSREYILQEEDRLPTVMGKIFEANFRFHLEKSSVFSF